jgi:outer membrane protein OmpA-like peptidoglycan-associated protein
MKRPAFLFSRATASLPTCDAPSPGRRAQLAWFAGAALTGLAGCATPPAPMAVDPQAARVAELKRLGFKQTDEGWEFSFPGKILFEVASDALDPASQTAADRIGTALLELGVERLRVEGHTDNVGSATFYQQLSLRRAEAVARALSQKGLPLDRMEVRGLGKEKPIVDNNSVENRSQNRRVAVIVPAQ